MVDVPLWQFKPEKACYVCKYPPHQQNSYGKATGMEEGDEPGYQTLPVLHFQRWSPKICGNSLFKAHWDSCRHIGQRAPLTKQEPCKYFSFVQTLRVVLDDYIPGIFTGYVPLNGKSKSGTKNKVVIGRFLL